ncbi:hypothetical protein NDU88_011661 [Pleurodeles waltl]|uniref:Uncharacterized protein n=1 Tax=Pleurodeles waltl TaxID=8319 RepID=A0AAV7S1U0_PLEWA|nr:hypothetical protein NDU88_011661 [Pleurodeles waltl]
MVVKPRPSFRLCRRGGRTGRSGEAEGRSPQRPGTRCAALSCIYSYFRNRLLRRGAGPGDPPTARAPQCPWPAVRTGSRRCPAAAETRPSGSRCPPRPSMQLRGRAAALSLSPFADSSYSADDH